MWGFVVPANEVHCNAETRRTRVNRSHRLPQRTVRGSWRDSASSPLAAATVRVKKCLWVLNATSATQPPTKNALLQIKCVERKKKGRCIVPSILGSSLEVSNATASTVKSLYLGCSLAAGVVWKVRHMSYDSQHGSAESKGGQFLSRQLGASSSDGRLPGWDSCWDGRRLQWQPGDQESSAVCREIRSRISKLLQCG